MKIAYGYSVEPTDDPLVALANEALDKFSRTTLLGEFPVDIFPISMSALLLAEVISAAYHRLFSALYSFMGPRSAIQEAGKRVETAGKGSV